MPKKVLSLIFLTLLMLAGSAMAESKVTIIPRPLEVKELSGDFTLKSGFTVSADADFKDVATYLNSETLKRRFLKSSTASNADVKIQKSSDASLGEEGYTLDVTASGVTIKANTAQGAFYGVQSLLQLIPVNTKKASSLELPQVSIKDVPRFTWRASHLDVCRHFFPVEFVKKYIDYLAMHKYNKFHWHLTEDQGWRVAVDKYPKLTEISAWRKINDIMDYESNIKSETAEEIKARLIAQGSYKEVDGQAYYGGFYTKEQMKEVVAYAKSRYIQVIPEIEMPGHTQAVMAAYPHMACEGAPEEFEVWTRFGVSRNVFCAGKEVTFTFLEDVLTEVLEIFPSPIIHIGGDECPKSNWKECSDCQKRIADNKLHDEHELQSWFIKRMQKWLNKRDRKIVGWSEIIEGGLAPGATVMAWLGPGAGITAAKMGNPAVMTPFGQTYYNMKEDPTGQGPGHSSSYLPLKNVYGYDPVPTNLEPEVAKNIIGYQPCLWTEYVPTIQDVEYLTFPRLAASAEVAWTSLENRDFNHFQKRVNAHYARLDVFGTRYFVNPPILPGKRVVITGEKSVEISTEFPNGKVHYTLDGSEAYTRLSCLHSANRYHRENDSPRKNIRSKRSLQFY